MLDGDDTMMWKSSSKLPICIFNSIYQSALFQRLCDKSKAFTQFKESPEGEHLSSSSLFVCFYLFLSLMSEAIQHDTIFHTRAIA